jgi:beta-phosphoglucomutase-like phosphatase (HAD superfamily)
VTPVFPYRTVLFDVDGTLIDSNDAHASAWAQALTEHGIEGTVSDVRRLIGMAGTNSARGRIVDESSRWV